MVGLQVLVVSVEPRAFFIRHWIALFAHGFDIGAVSVRLLQAVWEIVRVKVIFLLVRLVDGTFTGLVHWR